MKTFLCSFLTILATASAEKTAGIRRANVEISQDFQPADDTANGAGDRCRSNDECGRDLLCVDNVCAEESGNNGGINGADGTVASDAVPAGHMCMSGQTCAGGLQCPSCLMPPCTCPAIVETSVL